MATEHALPGGLERNLYDESYKIQFQKNNIVFAGGSDGNACEYDGDG